MLHDAGYERYGRPQDSFDEILGVAFRKFGPRLVDLSYANPYDGPDPEVVRVLRETLDEDRDLSFQYTPYGGATTARRLIASQLSRRFDLQLNYRDIVLTPGAMSALNVAFRTLFGPEREVVVLTPCWLDYPLYLANLGIPFRFVPLGPDKRLDLDAIRAALGPTTAGILLTHPGCPSGVVCSADELEGLGRVVAEAEQRDGSRIFVISDECHRDIVWGSEPFRSSLCFHPRTLSLYSFGKSLFLQGQRIGYVAVSPDMPERDEVRTALVRSARKMGFCTPTNLMQRAVTRLLDHKPPLEMIAERQQYVRGKLEGYGYEVCVAGATFFVYARCPDADDFAFTRRLADRGVVVLPSSLFHEPGFFRISVTAKEPALRTALPAFAEVL